MGEERATKQLDELPSFVDTQGLYPVCWAQQAYNTSCGTDARVTRGDLHESEVCIHLMEIQMIQRGTLVTGPVCVAGTWPEC